MTTQKIDNPVDDVDFEQAAAALGRSADVDVNFARIDQDVRALIDAAIGMMEAEDGGALALALDHNLKLWIAIRVLVGKAESGLPPEVTDNLAVLADYVTQATLGIGRGEFDQARLQSLININLHIAEGLTKGQQERLIRERAYQLWEQEGRPHGRDGLHWQIAEQEIAAGLVRRPD
ncbi:MAG: DUF2934 domain-containing protein [Azospirillum sp.]|nr:DUF2934 domain-containing protein [Azospirillum sp.]